MISQEDLITFPSIQQTHGEDSRTSTDYEKFTQTEQQATTLVTVNKLGPETLPEVPLVIPASSYAVRRESMMSVLLSASPKDHQISHKPSIRSSIRGNLIREGQQAPQLRRSGSMLMIVGEYIKPIRP